MAQTDATPPTKPIVFKGRTIEVLEPSDEQFIALVRLSRLPTSADGISQTRMLATLNRVPDLARALCAHEDDREWLEDGLVDSSIKVLDFPEFCFQVITEWWGEQGPTNRASRRRPAKKAPARLVK